MPGPYDIGDGVTMRGTFEDLDGNRGDPTEVTLTVLRPSGAGDEPEKYAFGEDEITRESEGVFSKKLEVDEPGVWRFHFEGDGSVQAAEETRFLVRRRRTF